MDLALITNHCRNVESKLTNREKEKKKKTKQTAALKRRAGREWTQDVQLDTVC